MATWNTWGEEEPYCWVVICKNHKFHKHQNLFFGHKILLGEANPYLPPPAIPSAITVHCDDCGHRDLYNPSELVRVETEIPPSFTPHPEFV